MSINLDKFIFISTAIPFGANGSETVSIPLGGPVSTSTGKTVWSDIIEVGSYSISPRISYKIPSGSWLKPVGTGSYLAGSVLMGGAFRYRLSASPLRDVIITPSIQYDGNGVRLGVIMGASYSGTNPGTITVPTVDLEMTVQFDVIPNNIK